MGQIITLIILSRDSSADTYDGHKRADRIEMKQLRV